jgi:isopentenyl diphosphate isomerase/L-lactate dehydrogenase-like FMN-dependent dehydrogenase
MCYTFFIGETSKKRWRKETRMQPINISEYEILAKERMNPVFWDFYAGGSDDEITLRANQADFARIRLRPRILVDVNQCDTSTSVLGRPVPMPILVAPTSMHCLAHPEGECATAQGAGAANTLMIASTDATRPLEEIAQAASGPLWFQLYIYGSLEWGRSCRELCRRTTRCSSSTTPTASWREW